MVPCMCCITADIEHDSVVVRVVARVAIRAIATTLNFEPTIVTEINNLMMVFGIDFLELLFQAL